jgi:hypothetical protein
MEFGERKGQNSVNNIYEDGTEKMYMGPDATEEENEHWEMFVCSNL